MATKQKQGQLAGVVAVIALLLTLVVKKKRSGGAGALPGTAAMTETAKQAGAATASTMGRAGELAQNFIGEASSRLGEADVEKSIEMLQHALEDVRGALSKVMPGSGR